MALDNWQVVALAIPFLLAWYAFQHLSTWLVAYLMPANSRAADANKFFVAGMRLLQGSDENKGNLSSALQQFDEALRVDPQDASTRLMKAFTLESMGDINACLKEMDEVLEGAPPGAPPRPGLGPAPGRLDPSMRADVHRKRGLLLLEKKRRPDAALRDFEAAMRLGGARDAGTLCQVAFCLEAKRQPERAAQVYDEALKADGSCAPASDGLRRLQGMRRNAAGLYTAPS